MRSHDSYALLDVGDGARLERFGDRVVDRPHPAAFGARADPGRWREADLRFDRERGWTGPAGIDLPWPIAIEGLTLELRATPAGQVGIFPEHLAMLPWLEARIAARHAETAGSAGGGSAGGGPPGPAVLHLFAYTGLVTLAIARAGGAVSHVDSSRPTVAWARRNAERSDLATRPIRWIVDDALDFTRREARRGHRYAGVVLDPPSYGHGPAGRPWRFEDDLDGLLEGLATVVEPDGFVLLTAHTPGFDGDRLAERLGRVLPHSGAAIDRAELELRTADGRGLELGAFARWSGGA